MTKINYRIKSIRKRLPADALNVSAKIFLEIDVPKGDAVQVGGINAEVLVCNENGKDRVFISAISSDLESQLGLSEKEANFVKDDMAKKAYAVYVYMEDDREINV